MVLIQSTVRVSPASHEHLKAELEMARRSRQEILASLRHWDERVSALEDSLHSSAREGAGTNTQAICWRDVKLVSVWSLLFLVTVQMVGKIVAYNETKGEYDVSWFHDAGTVQHTTMSFACIWLLLGIIAFTEFLRFTDSQRYLSIAEAVYVSAQIVTTVGYGDLTPSTDSGKVFMAVYCVIGVAIIATLMQELVYKSMIASEKEAVGKYATFSARYGKFFTSLIPVIGITLFSTMFYSLYSSEQKTPYEAFYMSVITLLTIGFGAYHPITELGQVIGSVWMVLGVVFVGESIVALADGIFQHRTNSHAYNAASRLFNEMGAGKTRIDAASFLRFELIRSGVSERLIDSAMQLFNMIDTDKDGVLSFDEFRRYVESGHDI
jgi:hypothetical protein